MSDALYKAKSTTGRITALERKITEQAEQLRQKAEAIRELATALETITYLATGLHLLYRRTSKTESDGSYEKAFADALALVRKVGPL